MSAPPNYESNESEDWFDAFLHSPEDQKNTEQPPRCALCDTEEPKGPVCFQCLSKLSSIIEAPTLSAANDEVGPALLTDSPVSATGIHASSSSHPPVNGLSQAPPWVPTNNPDAKFWHSSETRQNRTLECPDESLRPVTQPTVMTLDLNMNEVVEQQRRLRRPYTPDEARRVAKKRGKVCYDCKKKKRRVRPHHKPTNCIKLTRRKCDHVFVKKCKKGGPPAPVILLYLLAWPALVVVSKCRQGLRRLSRRSKKE
jgi:hypothetical protein